MVRWLYEGLGQGPGEGLEEARDPRIRPSGTRGLHQLLRCAIAFCCAFAVLHFAFASLRFRFASRRFSNRTASNLEAHTLTGSADIYAYIYTWMHILIYVHACIYTYMNIHIDM